MNLFGALADGLTRLWPGTGRRRPPPRPAPRPPIGAVHLGDLATALGTLNWHDDTQARHIAACLGLALEAPLPPAPAPPQVYDHRRESPPVDARSETPRPPPVYVPPAPRPPPVLPGQVCDIGLEKLPDLSATAFDWSGAADSWPDERAQAPCARATLFPERTSRHLTAAALTTWRPGHAIDLPRLIAALAGRRLPRRLPRRPEPTLARGCQVILDYNQTMVPFWPDLDDLGRQVTAVVGAEASRLYGCDGDPRTAARWRPGRPAEPWRPDGSPVLAATDFGTLGRGGPRPHPGWDAVARACAAAGSPLLILIPWPPERWPRHLAGRPVLIHWSPDTGVGQVRRALGPRRRAS